MNYNEIVEVVSNAPWYRLIGMKPKIKDNEIIVEMGIDKAKHLQALRLVHGGAIASVLDSAIGLNVNKELIRSGKAAVTAQLNIHYVKPAFEGKIIGIGKALHIGNKITVGYGEVRSETGELIATGTATFYVVDRKGLNFSDSLSR